MTALELLTKKYRLGYTDAEAYILFTLGERPGLNLTELVEAPGFPLSTAHAALSTLLARDLIRLHPVSHCRKNKKYYILTDAGRVAIVNLLR